MENELKAESEFAADAQASAPRKHGAGALDRRSGTEGPGRRASAERPRAPQGWRPAASVEPGRDVDRGSAQHHRAGHARRSLASAVMGIEKPRQGGGRVAEAGPPCDSRLRRLSGPPFHYLIH
jgi:hypothetical protein